MERDREQRAVMEEGGEGEHDAAGNHMHETAYDTEVSAEEAAAAEAPAHGASNSDNANATQTPAAAAWEPPPAPAGPLSGKQKLAHAHEVLSITDGSPDSPTIRKAFRRACLKSHPDKIARAVGMAEAERRFLMVTQAFETASGFRETGALPEPDVGPDDANEMHPGASDSENEEERKERKRKRKQEGQDRKAEAEAKRARKQEARGRKEWWGSDYPEEEDEDCYSEEECEGEAHGRPRWEGRGKQGAQWNSGDRARGVRTSKAAVGPTAETRNGSTAAAARAVEAAAMAAAAAAARSLLFRRGG